MTWAGSARLTALAEAVAIIYGTTCWLCHEEIDTQLPRRNPRGFSVDHKIPRSHGGTDNISNLRPAHLACNLARGNRPGLPAGRRPAYHGRFSSRPKPPTVPQLSFPPRGSRKKPENQAETPDTRGLSD